jgi:hypothetical protein
MSAELIANRLHGIEPEEISDVSTFASIMLNDNYTLRTKSDLILNVSSYLVVSCTKQIQEVAVAQMDHERSWIRLAKLKYPYGITELCQKDQNNYKIWSAYSCPANECSKMLGTCIHGEVPEMYHPAYLDQWNTQIRIPPPRPQEKVLAGPSPEVSSEILKANIERRRKAQSEDLADGDEAKVKTAPIPKEESEPGSAPVLAPKQLNMEEAMNAAGEDAQTDADPEKSEDKEDCPPSASDEDEPPLDQ